MRIIIAAGGTGGHIYPGIAVAEEVMSRDPNNEVLFIGSHDGLEGGLVKKEGFSIKLVYARGILRKISYKAISAPIVTAFGFIQSLFILSRFKPDAVIMTGGYVSFPVALAAKLIGIKTILHEQNVLPGFVNRLISKFVDITTLSFEGSLKYIKGIVAGNPVRKRILSARGKYAPGKKVLVVGGSQGARSINNAIASNLDFFKNSGVTIEHIIGERDYASLIKKIGLQKYPFYRPISYMYNIEEGLKNASLVVSRAGATAIAEFLALGLPSVRIPFPYSAEGHQDLNAEAVCRNDAGMLLKEREIEKLPQTILALLNDSEKLVKMSEAAKNMARPDAAEKFVDLLYEPAAERRG